MVFESLFTYPLGLYALLALIPFILLYLIKPKSKNIALPTMQFLMKKKGKQKMSSFLRNWLRNLLFLIQLLILLLLAFSVAEPFIKIPSQTSVDNSVIVLDVSASMESVFDEAITQAKRSIGRTTSIVLVQDSPLVVLERGSSGEAREILNKLKPSISSSNIADSVNTAYSLIEGEAEGEIILISDLRQTTSGDLIAAKARAESDGFTFRVIDLGEDNGNVGITNVVVERAVSKIYVKNFFNEAKTVTLMIDDEKKIINLDPRDLEIVDLQTPKGITKLEIIEEDDLMLDNIAYIATPENSKIRVLLVTEAQNSYLQRALESSPTVELDVAGPPLLPNKDFDVVIFHDISINKLLAGTMNDIEEKAKSGLNVVFTYNDNPPNTDLLPIDIKGFATNQSEVVIKVTNSITQGKDFGVVNKYYDAEAKPGAIVLAETKGGDPIIVMRELGVGKIIFFGISEQNSDFKLSPSFPLFWDSLLLFFEKVDDYSSFNKKGGEIELLGKQTDVSKPSGDVITEILLFDESGVYEYDGKKVVASMINPKESDLSLEKVNVGQPLSGSSESSTSSATTTTRYPYTLTWILLFIGLIFVLFEVYYISKRGDI